MSADRETNHDMATHRDIALLLAEAADEVEIGTAPYQAVVLGGRRRKARRWAVAAAAALVIAGSTGTLALAGGLDGDGHKVAPVATRPPTAEERHVYEPQGTALARGTDHGKDWEVSIDVWGAPKNEEEAQYQRTLMGEYGAAPVGVRTASELIGKSWLFVRMVVGDGRPTTVVQGPVDKGDSLSGTDIMAYPMPLDSDASGKAGVSNRLVIGNVAPTAQQVTCSWDDGTTTKVVRAAPGTGLGSDFEDLIRPVDGSQPDWFVCLGADGKSYKSAKVTMPK